MKKQNCKILFLIFLIMLLATQAFAEPIKVSIYGPGKRKLALVVASPTVESEARNVGSSASSLASKIQKILQMMPFFDVVSPENVIGGSNVGYKKENIAFDRLGSSNIDVIITSRWVKKDGSLGNTELRAFYVYGKELALGKTYKVDSSDQLDQIAIDFCTELLNKIAGIGDVLNSAIVYEKRTGQYSKNIFATNFLGGQTKQLTNLPDLCLSPSVASDGRVVFSYVNRSAHRLGIATGNSVQLIKMPGNMVISPTVTPSGAIAVSLNPKRNQNIYLVNGANIISSLAESNSIDVSPSFDASGTKMVFTSARLGNPNIFLYDKSTGSTTRLTYTGNYNTNPSISPDGTQVVFSRRTDAGHRIFIYDLQTKEERQISFGPGSDEDPAFAPDNYFVAFTSSRSGNYQIYLTTKNGDSPVLLNTGGEAKSPSWSKKF